MTARFHLDPLYTPEITLTAVRLLEQFSYILPYAQERQRRTNAVLHPSRKWLAEKLGVSIKTISRAISFLARNGFIKKAQTRTRGGQWRPNWYWLAADRAHRIRYLIQNRLHWPRRGPNLARITKNNVNSTTTPATGGPGLKKISLTSTLLAMRSAHAAENGKSNAPPSAALFGRGE